MAVNKNFVVKNGIEVSEDLIFASSDLDKVGIGSTIPTTTLDVKGQGISAPDAKFTGITTVVQEFNVGTGNTIFTVKGPRDYPSGSSFHSGLVGINTATPGYPVHIRSANPGAGDTINPTLYVEGDVRIQGNGSGTGIIEATGIYLDNDVGFVSTYNLDVSGISTFTGIATFTRAEFQHIIVSGLGTNAPSAVFSGVKADGIGATTLNVSGVSTFQNNVHLLDNDILEFGGALHNNGDFKIYHDGSNSYIQDVGTGNVYLDSNAGSINIRVNTSESAIVAQQNSSVDLYFDASRKFSTVGTGVSIVGIATASGGFEGYAGITTLSPSNGITTTGGDLYVGGHFYSKTYGTFGSGLTVSGVTTTQGLWVTSGIATITSLNVGFVTSGLVVGGGATIAGISSVNYLKVGTGGTVLDATATGTVLIGSGSTPATVLLNGSSIPSIGLVIALGG